MTKRSRVVLTLLLVFFGTTCVAVDIDQDIRLVQTANTQFSQKLTLQQVFDSYGYFKKVEWQGQSPNGTDSTVQVIGTFDLDKLVGLSYGEILPSVSISKATVDAFKSEFSDVQYIINFSLMRLGGATSVSVNSTSFNMIKTGANHFFPDAKLSGFKDIAQGRIPHLILLSLSEKNSASQEIVSKNSVNTN